MIFILSFNYSGGSHPGKRRTVMFRDSSKNALGWYGVKHGLDVESGQWRSFDNAKATNIEEHKGTEVDLSVMPKGFDAKGLERQFQAEGKLTFRDGDLLVAYEKPKPVSNMKPFNNNGTGLDISTPKGNLHVTPGKKAGSFHIFVYSAPNRPKDVYDSTNPADLLAALKSVLE